MLYGNNGMWTVESGDTGSFPVNGEDTRMGALVESSRTFIACQLPEADGVTVNIQINLNNRKAGYWVTVETLDDTKKSANIYMPAGAHLRPQFSAGATGNQFIAK